MASSMTIAHSQRQGKSVDVVQRKIHAAHQRKSGDDGSGDSHRGDQHRTPGSNEKPDDQAGENAAEIRCSMSE